jgi:hypothetical protein
MPFKISQENRDRVDALARRLGTTIPHSIGIIFWMLPILEALTERLEKLEARDGSPDD